MVIEDTFGADFVPITRRATRREPYAVAVSSDRKAVLIGSKKKVSLWNVEAKSRPQEFKGQTGNILSVAFSPNGRYILTGSDRRMAILWDRVTGKLLKKFITESFVYFVAFSPDSSTILTSSRRGAMHLWDIKTGSMKKEISLGNLSYEAYTLAFSPDGKSIAVGLRDSKAVGKGLWGGKFVIIESETGKLLHKHTNLRILHTAVFSPDGSSILTGSADQVARLWDASTGKVLQEFKGHSGAITSVAFSPEGKFILTGSFNGTITVWDKETGQELREFKKHTSSILALALNAEGTSMISVSAHGTIIRWGIAWDPANWSKGMTKVGQEAAKELFVTKLYQLLGQGNG